MLATSADIRSLHLRPQILAFLTGMDHGNQYIRSESPDIWSTLNQCTGLAHWPSLSRTWKRNINVRDWFSSLYSFSQVQPALSGDDMGPSSLTYGQYFHNLVPTFPSICISHLLSSCILKPKLQSSSPYPGFIIQSYAFMHFTCCSLCKTCPPTFSQHLDWTNRQLDGWTNGK